MGRSTKVKLLVLILTLSWINAQEYIENLHDSKVTTHFKEIPKSFEVQGYDANAQFQKYFEKIQEVAMQENLNIMYKVKVEILNANSKTHSKKHASKKGKSKKYNIPLKKTSMKLSNFEVWLRKMAEQSGFNKKGHAQNYDNNVEATTEGVKVITTTKQIQITEMSTNKAHTNHKIKARSIDIVPTPELHVVSVDGIATLREARDETVGD
ncbi:hypothetical protein PYW07_016758 [Mythimna separata]|uniref:Uncharacterized protein n=1 Tax=Mythimna separata TaxID=271217 RepID=A0AAD7YL26_MYTSE|nr:hypothetical protein PYW07_016758 [Mythimna separata]